MAGHGPPPKPATERRRRNKPATPEVVITADDEKRGPELPEGPAWPDATRSWWETWRSSPQAQTFTATDWDFLLDTALLHSELWSGNGSVAAELRLRVAKFGATPEDRARLRIQLEPEGEKEPAAQTPAAAKKTTARRQRLLKVVADGTEG